MSYVALYRKYRPNNFSNVVGQDVIVKILKNSLVSDHISHAYLFSGPRGTGKTSIAKIFAKAVNCENFTDDICDECNSCKFINENDTDIIEIDAASNNGVDEIRTIRDNVKLLPSFSKYKIYIIDEVHMLSSGAFNALLKTLEEPPSHVIFILATTEPNKIPLTIMSRCQRFDFNKVDDFSIIKRLKFILEKEQRKLDENIINYIAQVSDGGLRDAVNLLDQVISLDESDITTDQIDKLSGKISKKLVLEIFNCIFSSNYSSLLSLIEKISLEGKNYNDIINNMLIIIRDFSINNEIKDYFDDKYSKLLSDLQLNSKNIILLTKILNELLNEIKNSIDQRLIFEIYMMHMIEIINNDFDIQNNQHTDTEDDIETDEKKDTNFLINEKESINIADSNKNISFVNKIKEIRINNVLATANKSILSKILNDYDRVNDFISNKIYNTIAALLIEGKVVVASENYLLFSFKDQSYISVFDKNYKQIEVFLNEIYNKVFKVCAVTDNEWNEIKKEFIENKKNGILYVFIDENSVELDVVGNIDELENSALDIFGEDTISIR